MFWNANAGANLRLAWMNAKQREERYAIHTSFTVSRKNGYMPLAQSAEWKLKYRMKTLENPKADVRCLLCGFEMEIPLKKCDKHIIREEKKTRIIYTCTCPECGNLIELDVE